MLEIVTNAINAWDPLELFPYAPKDEYSLEIKELVEFLENAQNYSVDRLGNKIYELFLRTLGSDVFNRSIEDCILVAREILKVL